MAMSKLHFTVDVRRMACYYRLINVCNYIQDHTYIVFKQILCYVICIYIYNILFNIIQTVFDAYIDIKLVIIRR